LPGGLLPARGDADTQSAISGLDAETAGAKKNPRAGLWKAFLHLESCRTFAFSW
jgi:hypothetical protein